MALRFEIGGDVDPAAARRALELAEKNCPVLATVTPTVRVETSIEVTSLPRDGPRPPLVVPEVRVSFTFCLLGVYPGAADGPPAARARSAAPAYTPWAPGRRVV